MDVAFFNGKYHVLCPYCGKELELYGASIKSRLEGAKRRLERIDKELGLLKKSFNSPWKDEKKEKLLQEKDNVYDQIRLYKAEKALVSDISEHEKMAKMLNLVRKRLGQEEYVRLAEEAEKELIDETVYTFHGLMNQKFTNFEGA